MYTDKITNSLLIIAPLSDVYCGIGNFGAPALGPWRLASYLETYGYRADVWDCNVSTALKIPSLDETHGQNRSAALARAFLVAIEAEHSVDTYSYIGFSILSDTLVTTLGLIQLIRLRYPDAILIGGNHEATVNLQDCLGKSQLDALILGNAEESMFALMRGIEPSKVSGVIWRSFQPKASREDFEHWNDAIRWSEIPYHNYWERTKQLYDWSAMSEERRLTKLYEICTVRIHSLDACELQCNFCSVKNTRRSASGSTKSSIINLSQDALRRTLLAVKAQVPDVMTIYDSSDEAWLGRGRGDDYCAILEDVKPRMDKGLPRGMRYLIQCRTNDLTEELVDRGARAGVRHLTIGVESPVEQVRKDMRKPQREDHVRDAIRWGVLRDVDMYLLFIMFYPTITLEQLREAVENWRIYLELGATISVEPFCMSYLGTDLHDDPSFLTEHAGYEIPFSGTPAKKIKWATLIWPTDRRVCAILQWFRANVDDYIRVALAKLGHRHAFKGTTGRITVDCLEAALSLWDQGKIPPWEPAARDADRRGVYQEYGDQMSGKELANRTASRFNSTHASLDGAISGRIKDPALPHELKR